MDVKEYIKFLLPEEIYVVITTIYLANLDKLNKGLLSMKFENSLDLLAYGDYEPIWYFIAALCLFVAGGAIVYWRSKSVFRRSLCFGEIVASIISIIVIVVSFVLIYIFINNPILRAILAVVALGIAATCTFAK